MTFKKIALVTLALGALVGCSSTINSDNYTQKMNQPQIQGGDQVKAEDLKLNPNGWNQLDVTKNAHKVMMDSNGDYQIATDPKTNGYWMINANIINNSKKATQVKWRCKFYDGIGRTIGGNDNNQLATAENGLGWHTMVIYPVNSKMMTDDANSIMCVSPTNKAIDGKLEVHDMANDVTVYNK
ncbi:MAG: hypothetical protein QG673_739 [Pseudomonadota bacterium]|jgi:uncharacterized protein YcfL|nr:hypothetical protein [Pseudomonadota bacterium]